MVNWKGDKKSKKHTNRFNFNCKKIILGNKVKKIDYYQDCTIKWFYKFSKLMLIIIFFKNCVGEKSRNAIGFGDFRIKAGE